MTRVKKGKAAHKKRRHILKHVKGFKYGRKSKLKLAMLLRLRQKRR